MRRRPGTRRTSEDLLRLGRRMPRRIWPRAAEAALGVAAVAVVALCALVYSPSVARRASRFATGDGWVAVADGLLNPFRSRHLLLGSGLPVYDLKINHRQWDVLEGIAARARLNGWLDDDLKVWADAEFFHEGERYPVKVRLRGALSSHWDGPKRSYRIQFGKQTVSDRQGTRDEPVTFRGMHEINLVVPSGRLWALGPFANELLRERGLVAPRDRFVVLRINGVLHGLYWEVEHLDKPMLAAQRRPETTVFGRNGRAQLLEHLSPLGRPGAADAHLELGALQRQVDRMDDLGMRAMQVMLEHARRPTPESFRRARSVLDWEKVLRFRAVTALCGAARARFDTDDVKLYFDPSRGLLEPVSWDAGLQRLPREPGTIDVYDESGPDEFDRWTLRDPELRRARNRLLWEMVQDGGASLLSRYDSLHERLRPLVWADVLGPAGQARAMDGVRDDLRFNVQRVHRVLSWSSAQLTWRLESPGRAALEVACLDYSGLRLQSLEIADSLVLAGEYRLFEDRNDNGVLDAPDSLLGSAPAENGVLRFTLEQDLFPEIAYGTGEVEGARRGYFDTRAGRRRWFLTGKLAPERRHPLEWRAPRLQLLAQNAVTGRAVPCARLDGAQPAPDDAIGVLAYDASDPWDLEAIDATLADFLRSHPEFAASGRVPGAASLRGSAALSGTIIVPRFVPLVLEPGADVTLGPSASVVCYGGLVSAGTRERPIRVHGDGSGHAWGTFAALRPPREVVVRHTHFRGGGQAQVNGVLFTGGFAVHDGDLRVEQCSFERMQSEDALNLKNGRIVLRDCAFLGLASDAIDLDFVTGEVRDSRFEDVTGDAVDLSGSRVTVAGNRCRDVRDKGVSVGEDSHPVIAGNLLERCTIGVSCKDLSFARVTHCTFVGCDVAIEAKRKKPMFGPGAGEFVNCVFSGNRVLLDEDWFSRGRVTVQHSILDARTAWPACAAAAIRFEAPERGDYRLVRASLPPGFRTAEIGWLASSAEEMPRDLPGVFRGAWSEVDAWSPDLAPPSLPFSPPGSEGARMPRTGVAAR